MRSYHFPIYQILDRVNIVEFIHHLIDRDLYALIQAYHLYPQVRYKVHTN
jgi:hypothetical protein